MHARKSRATELREQIKGLDHRSGLLRNQKGDLDAQGLDVARRVAGLRESLAIEQKRVKGVNEGLGELPMIVGKNIGKVEARDQY